MRRVLLILLALAVLAPSMSMAATLYRCGHGGALRDHCCCAPETARKTAHHERTPAVRPGCCCETVQIAARSSFEREAPAIAAPPVALSEPVAATTPPAIAVPVAAIERPRQALGPPASLFVVHCALLL